MMPNARQTSRFADTGTNWTAIAGFLALGYLGLILYGSLFPFTGWHEPVTPLLAYLAAPAPATYSRTDILINILVYIPLGLLFAFLMRKGLGLAGAVITATMLGAAISFAVETLQVFLPGRVASNLDLAMNSAGTLAGAIALPLLTVLASGSLLQRRKAWLLPGRHAEFGAAALLFGLLVALSPVYPSLGQIRTEQSIVPLWQAVVDVPGMDLMGIALYAAMVIGYGMMASLLILPGKAWLSFFAAVVFGVLVFKFAMTELLFKVPYWEWRLSLKAVLGLMAGFACLALLPRLGRVPLAYGAVALLAGAHVVSQILPGQGEDALVTHPFNWIPFEVQMQGLTGVLDVASAATPFLIAGYLVNGMTLRYRRFPVMWAGALIVFAAALALELYQQMVPGRTPDITDALLAVVGWFGGWLPVTEAKRPRLDPPTAPSRERSIKWGVLAAGLLVTASLGAVQLLDRPVERPLNQKFMPELPAPESLPPLHFASFHSAHPRLPAPMPQEIDLIRQLNPEFLRQKERMAKGGEGDLEAAILLAYVSPGSQNLERIFARLMELEVHFRGNNAEIYALAYDWLYPQWSDAQRRALRDKLSDSADFIIRLIRKDRLSPYNVFLYNSPFQRLMAVSIVLYRDDPRGELPMRFTYDLWKNQMLPVWRQIMGKNGGWHEGAEYVGIGIGQAIYEAPAMWRKATGEDVFKSEPGIRGFLDFLIYRTLPDGSYFRWGDGGFFNRSVPDRAALALEYHDSAAYTLGGAPAPYSPTAWPWGPLADPLLNDPQAVARMPLSHYFDGIGMVVARSGWDADATHVSFKAGDNFWSHSHLDQGAFTIYKGGPLAIDSGLYYNYGTDHHMDYMYQTVAHNTLTVTDPADTVPARSKKGEVRSIANDGGQRRIGSGWGIEPAPLNLAEWQDKREIYHTGKIERLLMEDGLTVAVADITPAYTNAYSGKGTFSHRTRRVERAWRVFAYDAVDDVIITFDQVSATQPEFRKRWLLHTEERPRVSGQQFLVDVPPGDKPGLSGGQMEAHVLLPARANINVIGGKGQQFSVDGVNFDDNGAVQRAAAQRNVNPGAWRVEVEPSVERKDDQFLVVMLPSLLGAKPVPQVRYIQAGQEVGCEIIALHRHIRWWFTPGRNGVRIEIVAPGGGVTKTVFAPAG